MKDYPIVFTGPMPRAILEGRKTQTRRLVMPGACPYVIGRRLWVRETWRIVGWDFEDGELTIAYRDGTELWVAIPEDGDPYGERFQHYALQCCDDCEKAGLCSDDDGYYRFTDDSCPTRWRSPRFMPRWASRITLEVTDVRVQRLQDISEADAVAEGCDGKCPVGYVPVHQDRPFTYQFAQLWDSINAKRAPWESNPPVWAVTFKRILTPGDAVKGNAGLV